tara:strand:- start:3543 stop:3902 length:360 start_codon:yes stop_codon:yes gene_type:complete
MTRINAGIPPAELVDKHLLAEAREIKRIPNCVSKGRFNINSTPDKFCLGKGHVAFFYNKLLYLKKRYDIIYEECKRRGFNVTYFGGAWDKVPIELMNDYEPTSYDQKIIRERINNRLNK